MKIYSYLPTKNFTRFDKGIFQIDRKELKDGAKILYLFLASFKPGRGISQNYIMKSLGIAKTTLQEYTRQLKDFNLIYVQRTGPKTYDLFLGSTQMGADLVAFKWEELTGDDATAQITRKQLESQHALAKQEVEMQINRSITVEEDITGVEETASIFGSDEDTTDLSDY